MRKDYRKVALVIGMIGIMGIGYMFPTNAVGADMNTEASEIKSADDSDNKENSTDSEVDSTEKTQSEIIGVQPATEKVTESVESVHQESDTETKPETESIVTEKISVSEDIQTDGKVEDSDKTIEQQDLVINKNDGETIADDALNKLMSSGISYYLNMKRYESLSTYYQKIDELLLRKTEIYKMLAGSGEITELSVKQIETQEKQILCQKSLCSNEMEYNKFVISKLGLTFDDVDVKTIKNVGNIESYVTGKTEYDAVNIARYVTDCKNAISNISAKETEVETLNAASEQVKVLKKAGEASELDVIDSELAVLKAQMELEGYYYDMNINYYTYYYFDRD